jgi:hypothetical protein
VEQQRWWLFREFYRPVALKRRAFGVSNHPRR